ncbi:MAG TPA: S41 family peptidase [Vicinamibacterales bacterium]|nr:S41 family peptidase [Vicinamibacterales bacterium]
MRHAIAWASLIFLLGAAGSALGVSAGAAQSGAPPAFAFAEPGISPDGREIAFSSGGDIWSVAAAGGDARLLVAGPGTDRRPIFSPDGRELAFVSTRTGGGDIYVLTLATGGIRRVTWDDGLEQVDGWSPDGRWLYFSASGHDIAAMNDIFRVPSAGGTAMPVSRERYVNEFGAAASPDGRRLAIVAHGIASAQWWRKGSSHIDQSELWLMNVDGAPDYVRITAPGARQEWPMWSGDARTLFYVSDRNGAENIWARPASANGADKSISAFTDGRVLWPTASADGRVIAFERDFGIWTIETANGHARQVPITRRGAATAAAPERLRQTASFEDLALAPDGRKVAFIARGDIFAASVKDAGDAARVTATPELESQPVWSPDSRRLAYVSTSSGGQRLYTYDFATTSAKALTPAGGIDLSPVFSPDGRQIAFLRNRKELRVIDLGTGNDRLLASGVFADSIDSPAPVWSPNGRWIALFAIGTKRFTNVQLVPAAGGVAQPVSFLANAYANSLAWSPDGSFLLFDTNQRTEGGSVARVDLQPRAPRFREDLFRDMFSAPSPRTAEPANPRTATNPEPEPRNAESRNPEPDFSNIRTRLSLLPIGLDVSRVTISPDGKTAVVIASTAGQANLYSYGLDDLATERPVARQLTTTAGGKADVQFMPDGKEVAYLDAGRIQIANLERRESRPVAVTAELTVDFEREKDVVFHEAWTLLRDNFFDAAFHGVNWEASREQYGRRAAAASTPDELRRIVSLMIGDLNASHMGISAAGPAPAIGRLGLEFDREAWEQAHRLVVTSVVPLGPAALARDIAPGDVLTAVEGVAVTATTNLDERLAHTIDRRVALSIEKGGRAPVREIVVRPITQAAEKGLLYRAWVEGNREYVLKTSGGRLGYVHMINMSAAALDQLRIDLDVDNHQLDGVVLDIRNNNGGFVNAYALDVFARQPYLRMSTRGVPEAPARGVLGQRALESATVLVTNQHSLSDAEDFTEGYRTLKLGPVVGEPTAGWIIYTWDARLVDGSTLRLPRMRVKAADGGEMEGAPRKVDVEVSRPMGEWLSGKDSQLDEAVRTLIRKIGRAEQPVATPRTAARRD